MRAYLIIGDEDYLKQQYAMLLCEKAVQEAFRALNFEQYAGKNADLRDVFDRAGTLPMLSERRCILVDDYPLDTLNEKALKTLEESLQAHRSLQSRTSRTPSRFLPGSWAMARPSC